MTSHASQLHSALERLKSYSKALTINADLVARAIERTCGPGGYKAIPSSPSRGHEAELALRSITSDLNEIEHARATIEGLVLDPLAPWQ